MLLIGWKNGKKQKNYYLFCNCIVIIAGIIGVYQIKVSGSLIEDMPKNARFYQDIKFFENEFGGIMPLEILVDTKKRKV